MRKFILISLAILLTSLLITLAPQVHAQEDPSVRTEDLDDDTEDTFESLGEVVRIIAYSSIVPYDIKVYDPSGNLHKTIPVSTKSYSGDHNDISDEYGEWTLELWGTTKKYAVATYFVIPEIPLGTIAVLLTCFTAASLKRRKLY